jgi:hypothetical protein
MRLEALLRAHGFMKVERPPQLWQADTEDTRFVPLLGEMIAAALSRGAELGALTLNASNVVVSPGDPDAPAHGPMPGEYVAITVRGRYSSEPDGVWLPGRDCASRLLRSLEDRLLNAGARYAYLRNLPPEGSFTVFLSALKETL